MPEKLEDPNRRRFLGDAITLGVWERTRRMGINTLAYRLPQHGAMQVALSGGAPGGCEPLDWLHTTTPREWRVGTKHVTYRWEDTVGANPLRV